MERQAHKLNGQTITYDAVGNPINYMGNALTWTMGRQLASFGDISYTYNENGIRTSKTSNGVTTRFYFDGTNIIEQTDGTTTLYFFYDSVGEIIGFKYNGNNYLYVKNSMGDIVGIADAAGNLIASYTYDAWGKVTSVTGSNTAIGELNPFRYRSYYYDSDIQLYYLQSRYYDPEIDRFINADDVSYIGVSNTDVSYNAFAYCENNSINISDKKGYGREWIGFIVYDKSGRDFIKQANLMKKKFKGYNLVTYYCTSAKEFVDSWNSIAKNYTGNSKLTDLFLYLHGSKGTLNFYNCYIREKVDKEANKKKKESEKDHQFSELKNLSIKGKIYLNSCNGGTSTTNIKSVASILAKKVPGHAVRAVVDGSTYYLGYKKIVLSGEPYTKEKNAYWADFTYQYVAREKKKVVCITNRRSKWQYG